MWIAEGLGDGRWALVNKLHHCMVDGVSGTDLLSVIFDAERRGAARRDPAVGRRRREPSTPRIVGSALAHRAQDPVRGRAQPVGDGARPAPGGGPGGRDRARASRACARCCARRRARRSTGRSGRTAAGRGRAGAWPTSRPSATAYGGTVNDVVLAVIARGFRDLLLGRGEPVEGRVVRTMVPVSVRTPAERGTYNNKVSAMFADLPVRIADPVERLAAVRAQMEDLKESHQAVAGSTLTSLGGFAPAMLLALAGRVATRTPQHSVNTVTTNVPGPQHAIYFAGRRMLEYFPFVPLAGHVRIGVAIVSYDGALNFGVTGDYETAPDIQVLCDGIEAGIAELLAQATPLPRGAGRVPDRSPAQP